MEERFEAFSQLIFGIHGNIQKLKARYTAQLGLKAVDVFWLYLLRTHPEGLSASELAAAGRSDRSLVSRELNRLMEAGVLRTLEQGRRRRYGWKLGLTPRGEELAELISAISRDIQSAVSRDIPPEELAVFYKTLRTLARRFDGLVEKNTIQERIDHERKTD